MTVDDGTLWSRARAGDAGAFGMLFERHARSIYNYCFRRTGEWAVAEDLVSIVFLEVWRRRDKALAEEQLLPWLFGVATNVVRNHRRARRRHAAALRRLPSPRPTGGFESDVDARVDDERQIRPVLELIARLPRREQDVFILAAWFDLSYEDISLALDIPVGTVRSRLSRARRRLRELDPKLGHEEVVLPNAQEVLEP